MAIVKTENARKDIPLVSIIAVCYNHSKYVVETFDSILNQTYANIELVIIDSNSPDNSAEVIENWIRRNKVKCTFIRQTEPKNVCQNLNEGLQYVHGKYYQGISCDDILLPDKIEHQVAVMENDPEVGLIFGNAILIDENSYDLGKLYSNDNLVYGYFINNRINTELEKTNFIPATSVLIRKKCQENIGFYDEDIGYEDWDYWLRIANSDWNICFNYQLNSKYRVLSNSLWNYNNYMMLISTIKFYQKHGIIKKNNSIISFFRDFKILDKSGQRKVYEYIKSNSCSRLAFIFWLSMRVKYKSILRIFYNNLILK